jgi:heme O synthase-like polyprenyltransferase
MVCFDNALAIGLCMVGASNAFNQVIEKDLDAFNG